MRRSHSPSKEGNLKGKFVYETVFIKGRNKTHENKDGKDIHEKWQYVY